MRLWTELAGARESNAQETHKFATGFDTDRNCTGLARAAGVLLTLVFVTAGSMSPYDGEMARRQWTVEDVVHAMDSGEIRVRRSARRKKTISVSKEIDVFVLSTPTRYNVEKNLDSLASLLNRLSARDFSSADDLRVLAEQMSEKYFDGTLRPTSIRWVTNQNVTRWASTTSSTGDIRISHRLKVVPRWVLETVVVHELVHLQIGGHSAEFHRLADRHPRQAEAKLFLDGFSAGERFARGTEAS